MSEDYILRSDEELKAEVAAEIQAELDKIPKEILEQEAREYEERKLKDEEITLAFIDAKKKIEEEKEKLKAMTNAEFANWLIDKHEDYVQTINWQISQNFLNGESAIDKYMIILYMYNLFNMLEVYGIEYLPKEVAEILIEKGEADLFAILNVLGYT